MNGKPFEDKKNENISLDSLIDPENFKQGNWSLEK